MAIIVLKVQEKVVVEKDYNNSNIMIICVWEKNYCLQCYGNMCLEEGL